MSINSFERPRDIVINFPNYEHYTNLEVGASFPITYGRREGKMTVISIQGNEVKFRMDDSAHVIHDMIGNRIFDPLASVIDETYVPKLTKVLQELEQLEEKHSVSILSRGGAYGSSKLVIQDNQTGEEVERG